MKELSIKEKARRYDDAIERAKNTIKVNQTIPDIVECVEFLFPELKESEDEKVRKYIIKVVHEWWVRCNDPAPDFPNEEKMLTYLEKQGEHTNFLDKIQIGDKVTRNENGVLVNLSQLNRIAKPVEKQGEQKPLLIPKFRVGDIIRRVDKVGSYPLDKEIVKIDDGKYIFKQMLRWIYIKDQDEYELVEQNHTDKVEPKFKIGDRIKKIGIGYASWVITDIDEMHNEYEGRYEEGYPTSLPFFEQDDFELVEQNSVGFNMGDEITVNGQVCRVVAVDKPAWSEEDKNIRRSLNKNEIKVGDIITYFRNGKKGIILVSSFDARIYPRCKWGITDINGAAYGNWAPDSVEYYAATEKEKQLLYNTMPVEVKNWLDSLKPQLLPQQEWSEEDGKNLEKAIWYIEKGGKLIFKKTDKLVSWLKSLKDRHTWKPSDEQMKELQKYCPDNRLLTSLYEQLRKLKG